MAVLAVFPGEGAVSAEAEPAEVGNRYYVLLILFFSLACGYNLLLVLFQGHWKTL